jgi:Flp pilus assembly pilin Flp
MKGTMKMMKALRKGQTMVEYIIIVCLIAVSLIAVFTYLSRAIGKKAAGAASAISEEEGDKAKSAADSISEDSLKQLGED